MYLHKPRWHSLLNTEARWHIPLYMQFVIDQNAVMWYMIVVANFNTARRRKSRDTPKLRELKVYNKHYISKEVTIISICMS